MATVDSPCLNFDKMEESERERVLVQSILKQVRSYLDCRADTDHVQTGRNLENICDRVWLEFSQRNQKSPSRRNNNVHRNEAPLSTRHSSSRTVLFPPAYSATENRPYEAPVISVSSEDTIKASTIKEAARKPAFIGYLLPLVYFLVACCLLACGIKYHRPVQNFISRHAQDYIYPFMRFSRLMAVPLVKKFPFLTTIYEESCLVANPQFGITTSECWPCENARSIVDLTGLSNLSSAFYSSGMPFFVKDSLDGKVDTEKAIRTVFRHCGKHDPSFAIARSLNSRLSKFAGDYGTRGHYTWKINQVSLARMLRQFFPKPYFVPPESEVSVQHFLFVDKPNASKYDLPMTEFANVFIMQVHGSRVIRLSPVGSCQPPCKTLTMMLKNNEVLYYNWLYWHATSRPTITSTSVGVTYMGSFY